MKMLVAKSYFFINFYRSIDYRKDTFILSLVPLFIFVGHVVPGQCCGLTLSHGLVLHVGLTSLHLSPLNRIVLQVTENYYEYYSSVLILHFS